MVTLDTATPENNISTKDLIFEFLQKNQDCSVSYDWNQLVNHNQKTEIVNIYTPNYLRQKQIQSFLDNGFDIRIINNANGIIHVSFQKESICQE